MKIDPLTREWYTLVLLTSIMNGRKNGARLPAFTESQCIGIKCTNHCQIIPKNELPTNFYHTIHIMYGAVAIFYID